MGKARRIDIDLSQEVWFCECGNSGCMKRATDKHHRYSNTKLARKLYGDPKDPDKDYINHDINIVFLHNSCHLNKPVPKLTEAEFCKLVGVSPRSKSGRVKQFFG